MGYCIQDDSDNHGFIYINKACWIPSFSPYECFKTGQPDKYTECDPYPDDVILRFPKQLVQVETWPHELWRERYLGNIYVVEKDPDGYY